MKTNSIRAVACIRFVRRWWPPALHREIANHIKMRTYACEEWAEDHTHLQHLCRAAGCTEQEVEGDRYGVPGISDLADLLRDKLSAPNGSKGGENAVLSSSSPTQPQP